MYVQSLVCSHGPCGDSGASRHSSSSPGNRSAISRRALSTESLPLPWITFLRESRELARVSQRGLAWPGGDRGVALRAGQEVVTALFLRPFAAVLEDAGASVLLEALSTLGCEYHLEPQHPARSLRWTRAKPDPCPRSAPSETWAADDQDLLLLLEPKEFVQGIAQLTQELAGGQEEDRVRFSQDHRVTRKLTSPLSANWRWPGGLGVLPATAPKTAVFNLGLQPCGPACSVPWIPSESPARPHVAVIGPGAHLWSQQPSSSQETRQPETPAAAACAALALSGPRVEEALMLLQLWAHLDVLLVASWQELSRHVCALTKAFAQRPFKRYQESHPFSFCAAGRWAGGQRVARDGTGLRGVWWQQIRQFNRVSPAVADAIVTAFPSPRLLQQAYVACSSEQERMALLADLPVRTGRGARPRRVGPDLARRICLFLTTASPELLLDLGS
ncbi:probable crossover junction endonuclease EME2 [Suricata suricatta]|uniref:probable crossover junction endonuclease EME2 n=1 Tax=Suricata suricatta TaxID=37032 RepID=UPI0011552895|nr:probable crossover junction endonuclease EME2 [Suricata suricatta]